MKRITCIICLVFCTQISTAQVASSIYHKGWIDYNKNGKKDLYEDPQKSIDQRVHNLLQQMTLEEKTCQLATLYGYGAVSKDSLPTPEWKNSIWKDGIGNIDEHLNGEWKKSSWEYPYSNHPVATNKIQAFFVEETRLGIPVDMTNEGIRGLKHEKSTFFPAQIGQGSTWDKDLIRRIGEITGIEARALGYTNVYSPILDIARDPRWGRTVESYGEDPYLAGEMGRQQILGIQSQHVVSTPKHFAIYSVPAGGRDGWCRTDPHATPQEVHELHLEPFRIAFQEAGALGTMAAMNDYNGMPVCSNPYFLTELMRKQWGFKGYIVSDSWSKDQNQVFYHIANNVEESIAKEINAGINIRTYFDFPEDFIIPLRKAIQQGLITETTLNERVKEVLYVKFWLGLFDNPYTDDVKKADQVVNSEQHRAVSLRAARESIVLLKNEKGFLPLSKEKVKKLAVIGPNADEVKSLTSRYGSHNPHVITGLQGLKDLLGKGCDIKYAKGCNVRDKQYPESDIQYFEMSDKENSDIREAVDIAKEADVAIVFVGDDYRTIGESRSRVNLDLSGRQKELVRAIHASGTPVVLVMFNGRPATINWENEHLPAIIEAWYPGEFSGQAVAEVLFGAYNPGGKLSVTFPKSVGQIPWAFPFKPNSTGKGFARVSGDLYSFGHGLSYTTFEMCNLQVKQSKISDGDTLIVSCKVKNTGTIKGDEVVQLYLNDETSSISRYEKELCGFERVTLEPGEERTVQFKVNRRAYGMYDATNNFVVEPGKFTLFAGNSSQTTPLTTEFYVE
ncbi:MAG: glycoside hydrolase family 3 C-terminal domain-containing protein [Tannerellaceae bacterium]